MIKLTTTEARHVESTLEYLLEILELIEDDQDIPTDLSQLAEESLLIIKSANVYEDLKILEEIEDTVE